MSGQGLQDIIQEVKRVKHHAFLFLQNFAIEQGIRQGHSGYTKFIILGRSRVGSNFLRGLLNDHSQVVVLGEIFGKRDTIAWSYPGYLQTRSTLSLYRSDPAKFIETKVFRNFPSRVAAVGFKLFYYHAKADGRAGVWDYLCNRKDLKVIHIKRQNILKTHLSRKRAAMTDIWAHKSRVKNAVPPLVLDVQECLEDFVQTRTWEREYDELFREHDKLDVFYERLSGDYSRELSRIQEFLGLGYEPLAPSTYKQSSQPLAKAIANYRELKDAFAETPWEAFFKE